MSLFDAIGRVVNEAAEAVTETAGELAEGDLEGAAGEVVEGMQETGAAAEDAFNETGDAVNTATGGGLSFSSDRGTISGAVNTGIAGWETSIDLDASDGEVGQRSDAYVNVDGTDYGVTDDTRVSGDGVTTDKGVYEQTGPVRNEVGVTGSLEVSDGQLGADGGGYEQTEVGGNTVERTEVGGTVNLDGSTVDGLVKGSLDVGMYAERSDITGDWRGEQGLTVGAGVDIDDDGGWQAGVDAGRYEESNNDRDEEGVTTNIDYDPSAAGGQFGLDSGLYQERISREGEHVRNELGATVNLDLQRSLGGAQIGVDSGLYTERDDDRTETGVTANVGYNSDDDGGFQVGADTGVYGENEADDRGEIAATVNLDLQDAADRTGFQIGADLGIAAERFASDHDRSEAGLTANLGGSGFGDEGFQFGVDGGVYAENDDERGEAGVTANVDIEGDGDGFQVGVDAGVQAEHYDDTHTRAEAGAHIQADAQSYDREGIGKEFQFGLDAGVFGEHEGERLEAGATVNADVSAASQQAGVDGGVYGEHISGGSEQERFEAGFTANLDQEVGVGDDNVQAGPEFAEFFEHTVSGQDELRVEGGVGFNVGWSEGQGQWDVGGFLDIDEPGSMGPDDDGREGGRLEVGLTVNADTDGNLDGGVYRESIHRGDSFMSSNPIEGQVVDGGGHRVESGVTVGLTDDGVDLGYYREGTEGTRQVGRAEDGIHVEATDDGLLASGYTERTGNQGWARWDAEEERYLNRGETEIGELRFGEGQQTSALEAGDPEPLPPARHSMPVSDLSDLEPVSGQLPDLGVAPIPPTSPPVDAEPTVPGTPDTDELEAEVEGVEVVDASGAAEPVGAEGHGDDFGAGVVDPSSPLEVDDHFGKGAGKGPGRSKGKKSDVDDPGHESKGKGKRHHDEDEGVDLLTEDPAVDDFEVIEIEEVQDIVDLSTEDQDDAMVIEPAAEEVDAIE